MMIHLASESSKSRLSRYEPGDVQPNAIDLRIESIQKMTSSPFRISEDVKNHRGSEPVQTDADGFWHLKPGTYEIIMQGLIELAEDEAGFVITRSTLNRNGLFITSGLYDSGYHGAGYAQKNKDVFFQQCKKHYKAILDIFNLSWFSGNIILSETYIGNLLFLVK